MSSEEKQSDQRLETVLDFLSKEIAATSGPVPGQESQAEDIDSVVSNLLQQVVRDSETGSESASHEVERSGIDSMFAGMLGHEELKASSQGIFEEAVSQADQLPDAARKEIGVTGQGNVRHFPVERPQQQQFSGPPEAILPIQPPAEESLVSANAAPVSRKIETPAPVAHVSKGALKPARSSAMIIVLGCLAVVLVVAGSYFVTSQNGTESAAVATSMPVESIDNPANAPVTAVEKNSAMASNSSIAARSQGLSNTKNKPASTLREPPAVQRLTAATAVPNNSPVERVPARATPPAAVETVASYEAPAETQVPAPPAASLLDFSLPALPQSQQPRVAAPVMITEPATAPGPSRPAAKPKVAAAQDLVRAVAIQKVAPVYPELAKERNVAGTVILDIQISETGRVTQAAAVSGPGMLHAAALAAVRQWRFKPASLNGNNVSSSGTVSIVFNTPR
jgi:TonB family protein